MTNTDYLYALLSEGKLDLMYLPSGAVAWLFDRPDKQVQSAAALGMMAKDVNPITGGSCLRADENVLILTCEGGQKFRVYPDGGISFDGEVANLGGCQQAMAVPQHEMPQDDGGCPEPAPAETPDGFENMAAPMDEHCGCPEEHDEGYSDEEMEEVARAQGTYEFSNESMKKLSRLSHRFNEDKLSFEELEKILEDAHEAYKHMQNAFKYAQQHEPKFFENYILDYVENKVPSNLRDQVEDLIKLRLMASR